MKIYYSTLFSNARLSLLTLDSVEKKAETLLNNFKTNDVSNELCSEYIALTWDLIEIVERASKQEFSENDLLFHFYPTIVNFHKIVDKIFLEKAQKFDFEKMKDIISKKHISSNEYRFIGSFNNYLLISRLSLPYKRFSTPSFFLSDYEKIIFSPSFRRMKDKTQIYSLEKFDFVRNRLSHSCEVESISLQICSIVGDQIKYNVKKRINKMKVDDNFNLTARLDDFDKATKYSKFVSEILMCSSMLHDIGNPPFGHYGESIIRCYFKENWNSLELRSFAKKYKSIKLKTIIGKIKNSQMYNDFARFDGNAQSFRIATKLEYYKDFHGMNLAAANLRALIKYPWASNAENALDDKFGFFYSETAEIEALKKLGLFAEKMPNPFSTILEVADDIAYHVSDLMDSMNKKAITYENFIHELGSFSEDMSEKQNQAFLSFKKDFERFYNENLYGQPCRSAFETTLTRMSIDLKNNLIKESGEKISLMFFDNYFSGDEKDLINLLESTDHYSVCRFIKERLLKKYVYCSRQIAQNELEGKKILSYILQEFTHSVLNLNLKVCDGKLSYKYSKKESCGHNTEKNEKIFELLSPTYKDLYVYEIKKAEEKYLGKSKQFQQLDIYLRLKMVVDNVSGMTDGYAKKIFSVLSGLS